MTDLLTRLEAAKEGSREIDARLAVWAKWDLPSYKDDTPYLKLPTKADGCAQGTYWLVSRSGMMLRTAPRFTTSLDAITGLIKRVGDELGGWEWEYSIRGGGQVKLSTGQTWYEATAYKPDQPALALCIAFVKAMEANQK